MGTVPHWIQDAAGNVRYAGEITIPPETENRDAILDAARQALAANRTYLALNSPTNAQNLAQIRALTRQINGLIRFLLADFSGTD